MRSDRVIAVVCAFSIAGQARAADTVSTTELLDRVNVGYHGEFRSASSPSLWNLLTLGYEFAPGFDIEALAQSTVGFSSGAKWATLDPRFGLSGLLIDRSEWILWANANVEAPVTDATRENGVGWSPGTYQFAEFRPSGTRFSFGAEHWVRYYPISRPIPVNDVYGNASPIASFRVSSSFALQSRVSMNYFHVRGQGWQEITGEDVALEPGLSWNPLPILNLRPFASFRASAPEGESRISGGLWVTGWLP